ncbi:MAG: PTS sugar transporter subunit IIA [Thermotaleaceae bacterium]
MLEQLIQWEDIALNVEVENWQEAIYQGARLLLDKKAIEERYIQAIIKNVLDMGPYIVIAPGIALPHARPEDGVNELSMSLVTLKKSISFGSKDNDPVKLIITLAAKDTKSHLLALSQLMDLLCSGEDVNSIMNSRDKTEVIEILDRYAK